MSTEPEISLSAANAGELNKPKPRWMPLEGNPEVCYPFSRLLLDLLINFLLGIK